MNTKKKKINLSSTYRRKLREIVRTELRIVYITKSKKEFLSLDDAIEHQHEYEQEKEVKKKRKKRE